MPQPVTFSIITPSFNQGRFIKATLDSILQQDYPHVESLVMDGGSTDDTRAVLQAYGDPRLTWVSEADGGQADAINKGLRRAQGDILAYLNSDDIYLPGALRTVADYFAAHPQAAVVYGDCVGIDINGDSLGLTLRGQPAHLETFLVKRTYVPQPSAFWRREVTEAIGLFDDGLHYAMDRDYWVRMLLAGCSLAYLDRPLAAFRFHAESKTVSQAHRFWHDLRRIVEKTYAAPGLPASIAPLKAVAFAYADFDGAELMWRAHPAEARRLLRGVVRSPAPLKLRILALARYLDTYGQTPFADWLRKAQRSG